MRFDARINNLAQTPIDAWYDVIRVYQEFRQNPPVGRAPGRNLQRPGRSKWPEAETIRNITGARCAAHQPLPHPRGFPRSAMGLPIITQFKDHNDGDPAPTELRPIFGREMCTRMASPLFLKPLAITRDQAVPIILLMKAPAPEGVTLIGNGQWNFGPNLIQNPTFAQYPDSPLQQRSMAGSAIEGFLHYATNQRGFRQIYP